MLLRAPADCSLNTGPPRRSPQKQGEPLRQVHPGLYSEATVNLIADNGEVKAARLCSEQLEQVLREAGISGEVGQPLPGSAATGHHCDGDGGLAPDPAAVLAASRVEPIEQLLASGLCGAIDSSGGGGTALRGQVQQLRATYFARQVADGLAPQSRSMGCTLALLAGQVWDSAELSRLLGDDGGGALEILSHGPPFLPDEWTWLHSQLNAVLSTVRVEAVLHYGRPAAASQPAWVVRRLHVATDDPGAAAAALAESQLPGAALLMLLSRLNRH